MNFRNTQILILVLCFGFISKAQTKSNLDVIDSLISISVTEIERFLDKNKKTYLEIVVPSNYEILKGKFYKHFSKNFDLIKEKENSSQQINLFIESAKVSYSEPWKESFWGSFLVNRKVEIHGNIVINSNQNSVNTYEIKKVLTNTVYLDEIKNLEEQSLPFTKSEIPDVPLFTNFFEPIIVVGTLVVSTFLLFVVRSK